MKRLYLYFIKNPKTNEIKIGQSWYPQSRLSQLRSKTQEDLSLIGCIEDRLPLETIFHVCFRDYRTHGEWFSFDEQAMQIVNKLIAMKNRLDVESIFEEDGSNVCRLCGKDWSKLGGCSDFCLDLCDMVDPFEHITPLTEYSKKERLIKDVLLSLGGSPIGVLFNSIKRRLGLVIKILLLPY